MRLLHPQQMRLLHQHDYINASFGAVHLDVLVQWPICVELARSVRCAHDDITQTVRTAHATDRITNTFKCTLRELRFPAGSNLRQMPRH